MNRTEYEWEDFDDSGDDVEDFTYDGIRHHKSPSVGGDNLDSDPNRKTCDFCDSIISYALNFRRLDEDHPPSQIPQFHMEKEDVRGDLAKRAEKCEICAIVWSAINDSYGVARSRANPGQDLSDCEVWWEFARLRSKYDRPMLSIVDSVNNGAIFKFRMPLWAFLASQEREKEVLATGNQYASYHVLRMWYDRCLDHGGNLQDVSLVNDIQSTTIRLIDVDKNCLCDVPTSEPYLALSYVWGTALDDTDKLLTRNLEQLYRHNGLRSTVNLTRTVRDAIEVTKGLRFRYLFVDRLCIIQDDSSDMAIYVNSMHEIYNKANITIVAASGTSVRDGLPGTLGTPRTQPRLFHPRQSISVGQTCLVRVHEDEFPPRELLAKHLDKSVWATRGWTYQEQLLSERMLIFTDQAVFWKCSHITLYEDCPHDLHEHLSTNLLHMPADDSFGRSAFWWWRQRTKSQRVADNDDTAISMSVITPRDHIADRKEEPERLEEMLLCSIFRSRVQEFCDRTFTYQEDIARAFSGIAETFKMIHAPLNIHHGLITRSLPSELTWACTDCAEKRHTGTNKHMGLRTLVDQTGVPAFPTWSWYASLDQPTWTYGRRRERELMREMTQRTAMTTNVYTGTAIVGEAKLLFRERRQIEWRQQGDEIIPAPWMLQHRLRQRALIFAAPVGHVSFETSRRSGPRHTSLNNLEQLGLRVPQSADVAIVDWLQTPTQEAFARPVGLMCLTLVDEPLTAGRVARFAVLMLLSYRTVDGAVVAFREGLFTCDLVQYKLIEPYFEPEMVFLC